MTRQIGFCQRCNEQTYLDDRSRCHENRREVTTAVVSCNQCDPLALDKQGIVPVEECTAMESLRRLVADRSRLRRLRSLVDRACACLEANSDRGARLDWAASIRAEAGTERAP